MRAGVGVVMLMGSLTLAEPVTSEAQERLTLPEALRLAFPDAGDFQRRTAFLSEAELEEARRLAGPDVEVESSLVTYYIAETADGPLGVAYFDSHRVRALREVVIIVVTPDDRIASIEVLDFQEPPEYRAPTDWLGQFRGRELDDDLSIRRAIVNMTGATLTSRAVAGAARRTLALHSVIRPLDRREKAPAQ